MRSTWEGQTYSNKVWTHSAQDSRSPFTPRPDNLPPQKTKALTPHTSNDWLLISVILHMSPWGPVDPLHCRNQPGQVVLEGPVFEREGSATWAEALRWFWHATPARSDPRAVSGGDTAGSPAWAPMRKHRGNSLTSGIPQWATDKMLELWNIYTCQACVSFGMSSAVYRRRAGSSRESFSTQDVVLKGHGRQRRSRTDSAGMQNYIDRLHKSTYGFHKTCTGVDKVGIHALRAKGQAFKQDYKWWEWRGH